MSSLDSQVVFLSILGPKFHIFLSTPNQLFRNFTVLQFFWEHFFVSVYISEYVSEYTSEYVSEYTSEYVSEYISEKNSSPNSSHGRIGTYKGGRRSKPPHLFLHLAPSKLKV